MKLTGLLTLLSMLPLFAPAVSSGNEVVLGPVVAVQRTFTIDPVVCRDQPAEERSGAFCYIRVDRSAAVISAEHDEKLERTFSYNGITVDLYAHKGGYAVLTRGSSDRQAVFDVLNRLFVTVPGSNIVKIIVHRHTN